MVFLSNVLGRHTHSKLVHVVYLEGTRPFVLFVEGSFAAYGVNLYVRAFYMQEFILSHVLCREVSEVERKTSSWLQNDRYVIFSRCILRLLDNKSILALIEKDIVGADSGDLGVYVVIRSRQEHICLVAVMEF